MEVLKEELTELVYDAALSAELWPVVLPVLSDALEKYANATTESRLAPPAIYTNILPHFRRAVTLGAKLSKQHSHRMLTDLFNHTPIGIVLMDRRYEVVFRNLKAAELLENSPSARMDADTFIALNDNLKAYLHGLRKLQASECATYEDMHLTLLATPYYKEHGLVMMFLFATGPSHSLCTVTLQSAFGLSPAEAEICEQLARGKSVTQIAEKRHKSCHTIRTQLKTIFRKTSTHRQSDLIKRLLLSPAAYVQADSIAKKRSCENRSTGYAITENRKIVLRDGRSLAYAEYGNPLGFPVVYCHSMLGSRYERPFDDETTYRSGLRLIVPERPGYGYSSPKPGRSFLDWADDFFALSEHLRIAKCALVGQSIGGAYAAACALRYPDRITHLSLVSLTAPITQLGDLRGTSPNFQIMFLLSRGFPWLALPVYRKMLKQARQDPDTFTMNLAETHYDKRALTEHPTRYGIAQSIIEATRSGFDGPAMEPSLQVKPWQIDFSSIACPTEIWRGDEDVHSSRKAVERVYRKLPNAAYHEIAKAGHFCIHDYWQQIVERITTHINNIHAS